MALTHAVFDLDDTLYPPDCGLWDALAARIDRYMIERVSIPPEDVAARRMRYYMQYGTTLNGLLVDFPDMDRHEYLRFVHDVRYAQHLRPDAELDAMLAAIPLKLAIFTNADARHAENVLAHLGIRRHFSAIVDIVALDFVNKPRPQAYERLLAILGAAPQQCVFVEDSPRNIATARVLGMMTVLVRPTHPVQPPSRPVVPATGGLGDDNVADYHLTHVHAVGDLIRRLAA